MQVTSEMILFFDLDGTLVDTNYSNFLAYNKAIQSVTKSNLNLIFDKDIRFNRSLLKSYFSYLTNEELDKIIQKKEECFNDFLHESKLISENATILLKYSETNKIVLVSNCRTDRAMATLDYFDLKNKFNEIFCREFGENEEKINKFQNVITKLGVSPNLVIAFEDEDSEIKDAQNAGISIINPKQI